jgi:predicted PurR-regulated permease PerM
VGIATAVFITLFLLWFALKDVLAIFAGILLAVFLHGISSWLADRSVLSRKAALFLTVALLLFLLLAAIFLLIPNLAEQSDQLGQQLRTSLSDLESRLSNSSVGQILLEQTSGLSSLTALTNDPSSMISRVSTVFSSTLDNFVRVLIVIFVGFYLAYEPETYLNGVLKLVPCSRRVRYRETLIKAGYALRWWLVGRLASMAIVGILSIVGLMLLDVPLAFILGLLAGLLAFIPLLGPTLALLPPMLIALTESP